MLVGLALLFFFLGETVHEFTLMPAVLCKKCGQITVVTENAYVLVSFSAVEAENLKNGF